MSNLVKQIKCPPNTNKYNVTVATKTWIPNIIDYSFIYSGLNKPKNKKKHKYTIGENQFIPTGQTCSSKSTEGCVGKPKYIYHRAYPTGFTVGCKGNTIRNPIPGKTGLFGGLMEDLSSLNLSDNIRAFFNKGPYGSNKCMRVKLPVGTNLLNDKSKREQPTEDIGTWWEEEQCVPEQPTYSKEYGGIKYKFPYTEPVMCKENFDNYSKNSKKRVFILYVVLICICLFLLLLLLYLYW